MYPSPRSYVAFSFSHANGNCALSIVLRSCQSIKLSTLIVSPLFSSETTCSIFDDSMCLETLTAILAAPFSTISNSGVFAYAYGSPSMSSLRISQLG